MWGSTPKSLGEWLQVWGSGCKCGANGQMAAIFYRHFFTNPARYVIVIVKFLPSFPTIFQFPLLKKYFKFDQFPLTGSQQSPSYNLQHISYLTRLLLDSLLSHRFDDALQCLFGLCGVCGRLPEMFWRVIFNH